MMILRESLDPKTNLRVELVIIFLGTESNRLFLEVSL